MHSSLPPNNASSGQRLRRSRASEFSQKWRDIVKSLASPTAAAAPFVPSGYAARGVLREAHMLGASF